MMMAVTGTCTNVVAAGTQKRDICASSPSVSTAAATSAAAATAAAAAVSSTHDDAGTRPAKRAPGEDLEAHRATTASEQKGGKRKRKLREAEKGVGWREVYLTPVTAAGAASVAEAVACGHSVLLLDGLVSADQCENLLVEARIISTKAVASTIRIPIPDYFSATGKSICNDVLLRALTFVQAEIAGLLRHSLLEVQTCLSTKRIQFSAGEPGVNIYRVGGSFRSHEDGQQLTVLMNLSTCDAYEGGGTAFWAPQDRANEPACTSSSSVRPPTLVLAPPPGTVILFGGTVTHAGQETTGGERGLFVASFSLV